MGKLCLTQLINEHEHTESLMLSLETPLTIVLKKSDKCYHFAQHTIYKDTNDSYVNYLVEFICLQNADKVILNLNTEEFYTKYKTIIDYDDFLNPLIAAYSELLEVKCLKTNCKYNYKGKEDNPEDIKLITDIYNILYKDTKIIIDIDKLADQELETKILDNFTLRTDVDGTEKNFYIIK